MISLSALSRPSFRQLLLAAFALMAVLLGAVALRGQYTMEELLQRSRSGSERTLQLTGHVERLGEQTQTMERAARQYLVLGDASLRDTYARAAADAESHVQALAAEVGPALIQRWRDQRAQVETRLDDAPAFAADRDRALAAAFRELGALHEAMAGRVRDVTETRGKALQAELDAGRLAVGRLVLVAVVVAGLLALALALWLARPLRRVEGAIVALGENRLETRIEIRGPADVRQIGRRLDALRQRLVAIDADKARFLRHVSHELKTPLAALREGVALLQDGVAGPLSHDQREVTRILVDNTAALQRRIEDLLRFNAAAFAAQRPVRKATDIGQLVDTLVAEQRLQWRSRQLQVSTRGGTLRAEIDAALLGTAIGNLLANAIRFSPTGANILVTWGHTGDSVHLEVADEGPGVDLADRERIFEPFFRGQRQPERDGLPGTGIGLSIVAETVAAHGGTVRLLPVERGARFRIDLPHALAD